MKPIAWYDPTNRAVSRDKDSPLFTPLGQVWPLCPQRTWVGLTDEETMRVAYKAGFNIEVDNDAEEASEELHWWDGNGEQSDDALFKLRDYIEAKLKEKNT